MKNIQLTREQILALPTLLETKTRAEIAREYGVHEETISRWVRELRKRGHEIKIRRGRAPLLGGYLARHDPETLDELRGSPEDHD